MKSKFKTIALISFVAIIFITCGYYVGSTFFISKSHLNGFEHVFMSTISGCIGIAIVFTIIYFIGDILTSKIKKFKAKRKSYRDKYYI